MRPIRRFLRDENGVTAVEFSLVAVPFFLIVFGIIEFGRAFFMQAALEDVADRTLRQIYISSLSAAASDATLEPAMQSFARARILAGDPSLLSVDVSDVGASGIRRVTLTYPFAFIVNLTGQGSLVLTATRSFPGP
jgi:Flp pilus assembly protein TadG